MYAARKRLSSVRVLAATTVRRWKKAQIKAKQQQQQKKSPSKQIKCIALSLAGVNVLICEKRIYIYEKE